VLAAYPGVAQPIEKVRRHCVRMRGLVRESLVTRCQRTVLELSDARSNPRKIWRRMQDPVF